MRQKRCVIQIILISLLIYSPVTLARDIKILAGVTTAWERLENYQKATKHKTCNQINSYDISGASRGLSEMLLVCQALYIGGIKPIFEFEKVNNYARLLTHVTAGKILLMMESAWLRDADLSNVFVSTALLEKGEFEVGIFTVPGHKELLKVRTLEDLRKFKAISNKNWVVDWETLGHMQVKKYDVSRYQLMFRMVDAGRGDYMLNAFSMLPDMSQISEKVKLIPVPNIKIGLKGSRHILVNKSLPNAEEVFKALQMGLKVLRENGTITRAYKESGFLHPKVRDWKKLCCN